jgi:hypothetical protein
MFCNSTTLLNGTIIVNGTSINTTTTILNCYEGHVAENRASFIPTTTQAPTTTTTTERSLSFSAKAHLFFLRVIGKGDIADQKPKLTPIAEDIPQLSDNETWIPEALTIPPETTTTEVPTTTEAPFDWWQSVTIRYPNGTFGSENQPVIKQLVDARALANSMLTAMGSTTTEDPRWFKVYRTTTELSNETTTESVSTTTVYDGPYEWMRKKFTEGGDGTEMELVPKDLVEITETHNYTIPSDWVKVPKNITLETTTLQP